ncbi:Sugar phosphate transporter domain containing protein [Trema orientale]|uniref:Sugar phosphate transporter domain containing protein n=1 Tax=Trema orientale TaxID=63057 RepID=A0A2P5E6K2_TREOI|nr:Sugar phosphate transporter domain containing protein [Trema orientale]
MSSLSSSPSSSSAKKEAIFISSLVILWYSSNIGVLLLNKYLLSNYGFRFPIFLTMCHMSACAVLSYFSIVFLKIVPLQGIKSRPQLLKIATLSVVFCASVVGGNVSLRYLAVSFNQAVGATTPFFTALFAYLVTFKREAWVTYGALVPVVAGVVIASGGEPGFHLFGFIMCLSATAARAFKSVLQGILLSSEGDVIETYSCHRTLILKSEPRPRYLLQDLMFTFLLPGSSQSYVDILTFALPLEKLNSMNLMLYMSPIAVLVLLPASLIMEPKVIDVTLELGREHKFMWLLLFVNSVMAYSANLSNFLVTKHTSPLTLQVLGNAKGAVAVVISILLFRNPVTAVGIGGYAITVMGVVAYGEAKRRFR